MQISYRSATNLVTKMILRVDALGSNVLDEGQMIFSIRKLHAPF